MKKTLYEQVPVTEELPPLPEKGDVLPVLTDIGNAYLTEFGTFIDDNEEDVTPKWWSRPVTVTLPQEVSDASLESVFPTTVKYEESHKPNQFRLEGAKHVRDLLTPCLATLQGRIEELEAGIEKLSNEGRDIYNACVDRDFFDEETDGMKALDAAIDNGFKLLTSKPKP